MSPSTHEETNANKVLHQARALSPSMQMFKYVVAERIDVLQSSRVRFSQAAALNDPFELRPYFETLVPRDVLLAGMLDKIDLAPHLADAYELAPAEVRGRVSFDDFKVLVAGFLQTPDGHQLVAASLGETLQIAEDLTPRLRDDIYNALGTKIGILSLSAVPDNPLMWAHYADEHRGMVIRFNAAHSFFDRRRSLEDEFFHLREVTYRDPRSFESMMVLTGNDVFFSKHTPWAYEREWRVLAPFSFAAHTFARHDGDVYLFELPPDAITGVILGARASPKLHAAVEALVATDPRYTHLELLQATLDPPTASIVIEPLA